MKRHHFGSEILRVRSGIRAGKTSECKWVTSANDSSLQEELCRKCNLQWTGVCLDWGKWRASGETRPISS